MAQSILVLVSTMSFAVTGCQQDQRIQTDRDVLRVGVVTYTQDDPFINALTDKLKEDLKAMSTKDVKVIVSVKNGDNICNISIIQQRERFDTATNAVYFCSVISAVFRLFPQFNQRIGIQYDQRIYLLLHTHHFRCLLFLLIVIVPGNLTICAFQCIIQASDTVVTDITFSPSSHYANSLFFVYKIFNQNVEEPRVAIILPESGDQRWDALIEGMKQSASLNKIHLIICNTDEIEDADVEREAIREQLDNQVDAFIICPSPGSETKEMLENECADIPTLLITEDIYDEEQKASGLPVIKPDYYEIGQTLAAR